jgi:hypothetical protein
VALDALRVGVLGERPEAQAERLLVAASWSPWLISWSRK